MKRKEETVEGKKVFATESGSFEISQMTYYYSENPIEFSEVNEVSTINYSPKDQKKKKTVANNG